MHCADDDKLILEFAAQRSEEAFRALVDRHVDFVYSVALRQVRDPHQAEEITQQVFIDLAAKAPRLKPGTVLAGWLFRATRFASTKAVRSEIRRQQREREAAQMETSNHRDDTTASWENLEPLLNEALSHLSELDRNALLLRFFEKKALKDVAADLGMNEGGAGKRVTRAVEKLRAFFVRRGVAISSGALAAMLLAQTAQAAPVGLAASIAGTAISGAAIGGSALTLGDGILKTMALSKIKIAAGAAVAVLLAGGTTYVIHQHVAAPRANVIQTDDDAMILRIIYQMNSRGLAEAPPRVFLRESSGGDRRTGNITMNGKFMGKHVSIAQLLAVAYGSTRGRVRLAEGVTLPEKQYDYLVSLESGQREALQRAIHEQFGLTARPDVREEDVYVLTARDGDFDNRRPNEGNARGMRVNDNDGQLSFQNTTIDAFAQRLERLLPLPIVDESGLDGRFDIYLELPAPNLENAQQHSVGAIKSAANEQLGLDLQPGKRNLEVLLVESAKAR